MQFRPCDGQGSTVFSMFKKSENFSPLEKSAGWEAAHSGFGPEGWYSRLLLIVGDSRRPSCWQMSRKKSRTCSVPREVDRAARRVGPWRGQGTPAGQSLTSRVTLAVVALPCCSWSVEAESSSAPAFRVSNCTSSERDFCELFPISLSFLFLLSLSWLYVLCFVFQPYCSHWPK